MIKKILLWFAATVFVLVALVVFVVFMAWERMPEEAAPITSELADGDYAAASALAEDWLWDLHASHGLPSLSVAVGVGGQRVWSAAIGYADLAQDKPATTATRYRIGSISKSLTAVALLRMAENEQIELHRPLGSYVPNLKPHWQAVTAYQLATHTAGIRHYSEGFDYFNENFSNTAYSSTAEAVTTIGDAPLLFPPGEGFRYSTYGYTLLALAMEQAAGEAYPAVMERVLLAPAELTATGLDSKERADERNAKPYLLIDGQLFQAPSVDLSYKYAGGGFLSTAEDIQRFGDLLLGDQLLDDASREFLWTPARLPDGTLNAEAYALGFRVWDTELGKTAHHGGLSVGGYSYLAIYPELGITVAFMTNAAPVGGGFSREENAEALAKIFAAAAADR